MIRLENVSKYYATRFGRNYVLRDVDVNLPADRTIGVLGTNGAGKSTLLRLLGGMDSPNKGRVKRECRVSWPLALNGGFQGSMTGRENCRFICRVHGMHNVSKIEQFVQDFSELGNAFELPVKGYSSGMRSRFAFAVSMAFDFDVYLIDEIISVGDKRFRQKCKEVFDEKRQNSRVILVSHDMKTLRQHCDMGVVLHAGRFMQFDSIEEAIVRHEELCQ